MSPFPRLSSPKRPHIRRYFHCWRDALPLLVGMPLGLLYYYCC